MVSYLVAVDIIFQKKKCLTDPNHYKDSNIIIFHVPFNTEKNSYTGYTLQSQHFDKKK